MSKGTRQKVGIVAAFMHGPAVLLLDEPTSGLDLLMQRRFVELVRAEKRRGATILLSSHVLGEVEGTCDRALFVRSGRLTSEACAADLTLDATLEHLYGAEATGQVAHDALNGSPLGEAIAPGNGHTPRTGPHESHEQAHGDVRKRVNGVEWKAQRETPRKGALWSRLSNWIGQRRTTGWGRRLRSRPGRRPGPPPPRDRPHLPRRQQGSGEGSGAKGGPSPFSVRGPFRKRVNGVEWKAGRPQPPRPPARSHRPQGRSHRSRRRRSHTEGNAEERGAVEPIIQLDRATKDYGGGRGMPATKAKKERPVMSPGRASSPGR